MYAREDASWDLFRTAHTTQTTHVCIQSQDAGGLELYDRKGQWVAVKPVPQTLVINIGDMMQRWTNDRYKSTLHRVINPSTGKHRYRCASLLFIPIPWSHTHTHTHDTQVLESVLL